MQHQTETQEQSKDKIDLNNHMIELLSMLRNGSIVSGSEEHTNIYRQRCLQKAYFTLCTNISGILLDMNILEDTQPVRNLLDITAMYQHQLIDPNQLQKYNKCLAFVQLPSNEN
jgi:hypothetical protein|tara:strand:- start:1097 stop:1438 length:342 start_codon:yes stop_codon:yes gene_type:complete